MDRFFDLNNHIALKFQEIQYGFIGAVESVLARYTSDAQIHWALRKLHSLKVGYEQQLLEFHGDAEQVRDIQICFKCFDKGEPCTDCD